MYQLKLLSLLALLLLQGLSAQAQSMVTLERDAEKYRLLIDGKEFRVQGAGGKTELDMLAKCGGNCIRTWSTDGLEPILDAAHKSGLKVCVGLWLGHARHGFDYQNGNQVEQQLKKCVQDVVKFKEHPAILMWAIGNEMEGDGNNPAIWYAVDHIAREIKRIDPKHPTMTVIAELGENASKLKAIERFCPNVDIVGINAYGGVFNLPERLKVAEFRKPYIVTEHGPYGPWEAGRTRWKAAVERNSTEKGELYAKGFHINAVENQAQCLGTFVFLWGHKQETTATWFGMLLPGGERLAAVNAMAKEWGKAEAFKACPKIESLTLDRDDNLKPGEMLEAELKSPSLSPDTRLRWLVVSDSLQSGVGGDRQNAEAEVAVSFTVKENQVKFPAPESGGAYRLFAYLTDDNGGAAVANVPFFVDAPVKTKASPMAKLPFFVYRDAETQQHFVPSGYMGNASAIEMDEADTTQPHAGKHSLKVRYKAKDNWGGVLWQSPPNDWKGEFPGGFNFTGAAAVEFWARGEKGDEVVSFVVGAIESQAMYGDTARGELKDVKLTREWKKYRIDLPNANLSRIKTAFGWSLASQGSEVIFYLDDIQYIP